MNKILLAVDGSAHAIKATKKLIDFAQQLQERPVIVPIYVHLPLPRVGLAAKFISKAQVEDYYHDEAKKAMAPALKLLEKAGYAVKPVVQIGPVAETITAYGKRSKADLICLGTRGMTATGNLLMGSVATKVLHLADCPVLTIR